MDEGAESDEKKLLPRTQGGKEEAIALKKEETRFKNIMMERQ